MPPLLITKGETYTMMKKLLALTLALLMLSSTAFAAEQLADYYKPPVMTEGQYPIQSAEPVKLTYWMPMNSGAANFITSYDENPSYQAVQANTGVDIEFIHPAAGKGDSTRQKN